MPITKEDTYGGDGKWNTGVNFGEDEAAFEAGLNDAGWYYGNSASSDGVKKTHPVGEKLPNNIGLYDMHGNVWEWCLDWYQEDITGMTEDPVGPASGSYRLSRGGSWSYDANYCRAAGRRSSSSSYRGSNLGVRVGLLFR